MSNRITTQKRIREVVNDCNIVRDLGTLVNKSIYGKVVIEHWLCGSYEYYFTFCEGRLEIFETIGFECWELNWEND